MPNDAFFTLAPDWICVLSRSTVASDRADTLPIYATHGVKHVWLVDAIQRTLEVLRVHDTKWLLLDVHRGDARVRAEPFDAVELDLGMLWGNLSAPRGSRAAESADDYAAE